MFKDNDELTPEVIPAGNAPLGTSGAEAVVTAPHSAAEPGANSRPQVTFMGNSYDLTSVVAVVTGGVIAFSCLTCGMGYYCLPVAPVMLGLVGLLSAEDAVDPQRTRLLSWLGIGSGGLVLLLMILAVVLYVAFIILMIMAGVAAEAR